MIGCPSRDKPWLKYYSEEELKFYYCFLPDMERTPVVSKENALPHYRKQEVR